MSKERLTEEEQRLPQVVKKFHMTVNPNTPNAKEEIKLVFADGSEGVYVEDANRIDRSFPDGKKQSYYASDGHVSCSDTGDQFWLADEQLPDGTRRCWYHNGRLYREYLPDGTESQYSVSGELEVHVKNGVDDTNVILAKQRLEARKKEEEAKLENKPKVIKKVAKKVAGSKLFNKIAMEVAKRKVSR